MNENSVLVLKNLTYTLFIAGTVTVLAPYELLTRNSTVMPLSWELPQILSLVLISLGLGIYVRCLWDFARSGRGTPSPFEPPRILVVRGLYQIVRNPLYLGYLVVLLGESAFFESWSLIRYAAGYFLTVHLIVVFYEEPHLGHRFGKTYDNYRKSVKRWIPGRKFKVDADHAQGESAPVARQRCETAGNAGAPGHQRGASVVSQQQVQGDSKLGILRKTFYKKLDEGDPFS
jgi:protein-S-isoprenylcysteine O-methyltransferase Ste14